jgi:2',3'-cyclic-nucleotide 2'-phosphodiesterase (5'-nucleotidase family)
MWNARLTAACRCSTLRAFEGARISRTPTRRAAIAVVLLVIAWPIGAATLIVLHTSDLHGHVTGQDELVDRDFGEGLARVAAAVRAARAEGHPVLLLDSGDTIQGTPMQAVAFQVPGADDPTIRAMNRVGYDAMAVGNHEYDFGLERLEKSRREARFPWLSANTVKADGTPAYAPYVVRTIAGARVGILGLTTRNVAGWEPPSHVAGLKFLDTVEAAQRYVPILRGREKCDLVIVITHEGFERDPATGESRGKDYENHAYALATQVPGIDLLLTGHTHTVIDPRRLGETWISQPGRFGNTVTRFQITFERRGGRAAVAEIRGVNLPMKSVAPDPGIEALVAPEDSAARRRLAEVVARLETPLSNRDARTSDTPVLDWLHAVQLREGKADLSFASLLPGSLPPWPAGPLTVRQVWSFYPYENSLVTVKATGRQVKDALEIAGKCVSGLSVEDGKVVWLRNRAVWGYNCDTMDGAEYALDPTRPEGHRLLYLRRNGKPVGDEETFTVAINSYRAAGGGEYDVWRSCPRVWTSSRSLRDLLLDDARARGVLRLETDENWMLSPTLPEGRLAASPG